MQEKVRKNNFIIYMEVIPKFDQIHPNSAMY